VDFRFKKKTAFEGEKILKNSLTSILGLSVLFLFSMQTIGWSADGIRNPFDDSNVVTVGPSGTPSTNAKKSFSQPKNSALGVRTIVSKPSGGKYIVARGDCLWKIAQRFLGNGSRYWEIVEANKDRYPSLLKNPNLIFPGWELVIPGANAPLDKQNVSSENNIDGSKNPVPTPQSVGTPPPGAKGGKALLGWLLQTGLTGEALRIAWAVGMKESGGNPRALNGNIRTGDQSYGLFQINMIGKMGPARRKAFGIRSNEELFDPVVNCRVMMKLSKNGTDWGPWGIGPTSYKKTQTSPRFEMFYKMFPPK